MIYDISYKTLIDSRPLRIRFDRIDWFLWTRYLTFLGSKKYDGIFDRIRYLISLKSGIKYIFSHYFPKSKLILWFFAYRKKLTLHAIIFVKSVLDKSKNQYYYKIFLEKFSYKLAKK